MRQEGRFGKYRNPVSVIYCSATSYPKVSGLWHILGYLPVILWMCCLGLSPERTAHLLLTWCQPSSPGLEDPRCLTAMCGSRAGGRLQSPCSCHKHASLSSRLARASFFTWWLRNCPFLRSVIHSITSATFCPTRPAETWEEQETPPSR